MRASERRKERERLKAVLLCLLSAALALGLAGIAAYGQANPPERAWRYPDYLVMSVQDKQLMTEDEKALARETGIARFAYEGGIYAIDDLPEQYYAWHE